MSKKKEIQIRLLEQYELEEKKSKFSGALAYFYANKEIVHFHGEKEIDIRVTKPRLRALMKQEQWPKAPVTSDWVTLPLKTSFEKIYFLIEAAMAVEKDRK